MYSKGGRENVTSTVVQSVVEPAASAIGNVEQSFAPPCLPDMTTDGKSL